MNKIQKRLSVIKNKQVFETGSEKEFIRVADIAWLITIAEKQQQEISELESQNSKYRKAYGASIFQSSTSTT